MTNDLHTLATALYVKIDDLLKKAPDLAPWRPMVGVAPKLTDAELVTLAVMQALLGFSSESRGLRHAHQYLGHLFRYLPGQPGTTSGCGDKNYFGADFEAAVAAAGLELLRPDLERHGGHTPAGAAGSSRLVLVVGVLAVPHLPAGVARAAQDRGQGAQGPPLP